MKRIFDLVYEYNELKFDWDRAYNVWCYSKSKKDYDNMVKACVKFEKFKNKKIKA